MVCLVLNFRVPIWTEIVCHYFGSFVGVNSIGYRISVVRLYVDTYLLECLVHIFSDMFVTTNVI